MYTWNVGVFIYVKVYKLHCFIGDVVFFQCDVHVKRSSETFPGITCGMLIRRHIAVENFIHCFFTADFDNIIIFCKHVDDTELTSLNCQAADAEGAISPPWSLET